MTPPHSISRKALCHARLLLLAGFSVCIAACGSQGQLLNSERIEQTFGSYGVDVLHADEEIRVSSLYSGTGEGKITRTFAVVSYPGRISSAIAKEHAEILSGASLGAVFKSAGWTIAKRTMFIGELGLSAQQSAVADLMQIGLPADLAAHAYVFVVDKDEKSYTYATIVELHHPDYLTAEDLGSIYGEIILDDSNRTGIDDFIDPDLWQSPGVRPQ